MQIGWPSQLQERIEATSEVLRLTTVEPGHVVNQALEATSRLQRVLSFEIGHTNHPDSLAHELTDTAEQLAGMLAYIRDSAILELAEDILMHTESLNKVLLRIARRFLVQYPAKSQPEFGFYSEIQRETATAGAATDALKERFKVARDRDAAEKLRREQTEQALLDAEEAASRASIAADAAQESAGTSGSSGLATYFGEYADAELKTANLFRNATLAALGMIVLTTIVVPHSDLGDLSGIAYRVAILAAFSAIVAYLSSQASHHRKSGAWARSMQIQLKSFPAFVNPLAAGDSKDSITVAFASRVLGSPPAYAKNAPQDPALIQSVVDALLKRAN